jgi:hypothetical protein
MTEKNQSSPQTFAELLLVKIVSLSGVAETPRNPSEIEASVEIAKMASEWF